jgi:hypothetical protein
MGTACRHCCCRGIALLAADPELDVFEATVLGYIDRLRERLDEDPARATAFASDGFTALHLAAFFGKAEAASTLIATGAAVNVYSRNELAVQPLHSAAAGRHHEVCRVLIAAGADVNATQRHGYTPLHAAAQHGDAELVGSVDDQGRRREPRRHRRGRRPSRCRPPPPRGRGGASDVVARWSGRLPAALLRGAHPTYLSVD